MTYVDNVRSSMLNILSQQNKYIGTLQQTTKILRRISSIVISKIFLRVLALAGDSLTITCSYCMFGELYQIILLIVLCRLIVAAWIKYIKYSMEGQYIASLKTIGFQMFGLGHSIYDDLKIYN